MFDSCDIYNMINMFATFVNSQSKSTNTNSSLHQESSAMYPNTRLPNSITESLPETKHIPWKLEGPAFCWGANCFVLWEGYHKSNEKRAPGYLLYIWDYTTQLYGDYKKNIIRIPIF